MTAAKISYNEDDVNRGASKKRLYQGKWYPFCIKQATAKTSGSGHYMIVTQNAPLKDPGDDASVGGTAVRDNIVLPFDNSDVKEQEAPNTSGSCIGTLRAVYGPDEIPYFPRRDKDGRLMFKGEEIDPETEASNRKEVTTAAYDKLIALYEDPSDLLGHVFWGRVKHEGDFDNIDRKAFELPQNADVATADDFIDTGLQQTEKKPPSARRGRGKAKGNKKAA